MSDILKESIVNEVREQLKDMANFSPKQRAVLEAEVVAFLQEHEEQLNEALLPSLQKLLAKGTDRLRFMFLEKGNTRWIFVKNGSEHQAILFEGKDKGKVVKYDNEQDIMDFVENLKAEGFKPITREGGIAKFLKSVLRALSALIMYAGVVSFVVTASLMVLVAVTPGAAPAGAGAAMAANVAPVIAATVVTAGGWLMFKFSKKQDTPPEMA